MAIPLRVRPSPRGLPTADVAGVFVDRRIQELPLPPAVASEVRAHLARAGFTGEADATHAIPLPGTLPRTLFVIGTGDPTSPRFNRGSRGAGHLTLDTFRRGVGAAVQYAKAEGRRTVAVLLPGRESLVARRESLSHDSSRRRPEPQPDSRLTTPDAGFALGRSFAEGALLANYRFTTYHREAAERERRLALAKVELFVPRKMVAEATAGVRRATVEVEGVFLARNLVNEPASRLTPAALVEAARAIERKTRGAVELTVWNRQECEARGLHAFLAVARGSAAEPAFIHLTYQPGIRNQESSITGRRRSGAMPMVVLVGKGITFDSGGLSLKPAEGMETMKIDMAGAAAVLGVFAVLPRLRFPVEVHGMIAACENMPSGTATKPGDIVRSVSGKTIEILNTDAEGRLTLADVLGEAVRLRPRAVLDLATLTGACVVSLGEEVAGLFSNNDALAGAVQAAADHAGEPVWRLPLIREYRPQLKSEVADIKNVTAKKWGGAITAALFLQEFAGETPWAHLDIAGPSYAEKQSNPLIPVGGTGFGVRTVLRYLEATARS